MNVYQCVYVCYFPFGFEGGVWDFIVLIPNHCITIYSYTSGHFIRDYL